MKKVWLSYEETWAVCGSEHNEGDRDPEPPTSVVVEVSDEKWAEWEAIKAAWEEMGEEQHALYTAAGGRRR